MKKVVAIMVAVSVFGCVIVGCGSKSASVEEEQSVTEEAKDTSADAMQATESSTEIDMSQLEAIGDVEVDKGVFDVSLNIPKDFVGDTTQEELDKSVKEKGYKSATLNSDGSVTYVMTKAQHKEMMDEIRKSIDQSLSEMVGSEEYPNITDITANDDYTNIKVTTKSTELGLDESFSVISLYMYGGMYAIFNGTHADNIHVEFVNEATGEIIDTADSENMGKEE